MSFIGQNLKFLAYVEIKMLASQQITIYENWNI